jgi:hypothetical protein
LRVDVENNALIASAAPDVLDKIERDLAMLDARRPAVRVQAEVYEISARDSDILTLNLAFGSAACLPHAGRPIPVTSRPRSSSMGAAWPSFRVTNGGAGGVSSWRAQIEALIQQGASTAGAAIYFSLVGRARDDLFGPDAFHPGLALARRQQDVQALRVPIGYSLEARPRVFVDPLKPLEIPEINLNVSPRASTVDSIERVTGPAHARHP